MVGPPAWQVDAAQRFPVFSRAVARRGDRVGSDPHRRRRLRSGVVGRSRVRAPHHTASQLPSSAALAARPARHRRASRRAFLAAARVLPAGARALRERCRPAASSSRAPPSRDFPRASSSSPRESRPCCNFATPSLCRCTPTRCCLSLANQRSLLDRIDLSRGAAVDADVLARLPTDDRPLRRERVAAATARALADRLVQPVSTATRSTARRARRRCVRLPAERGAKPRLVGAQLLSHRARGTNDRRPRRQRSDPHRASGRGDPAPARPARERALTG